MFCFFSFVILLVIHLLDQFVRIHTSSLTNIETILNRPITKFYDNLNSDNLNVIATELRLTKAEAILFYKKHYCLQETMPRDLNKILKTKC